MVGLQAHLDVHGQRLFHRNTPVNAAIGIIIGKFHLIERLRLGKMNPAGLFARHCSLTENYNAFLKLAHL